jgi:hypothetical protein
MEEFPGMTEKDPLAGLDAVDWAGLQHAYGPAADVPGLLRDLRANDPERREKAVWELYGNIFHQGSRYEATAHAVPFLLALAADPGTPDRVEIVRMIAALAIGFDETYLPAGVPIEAWRAEVAKMRVANPDEVYREYDAWVERAADDRERRSREFRRKIFDFGASRTAAECELAAYDAVRAGVPTLCALLGDPDPALRAAAAYAVCWFPEESARALPLLLDLPAAEAVSGVAATAIVAAGLLGDASLAGRLRTFLAGDDPLSRWAAATALARLGVADPEVIGVLAACSAEPPEQGEPAIAFHEGDLRGYASDSLALLDGTVPDEAVAAVLDGLSRASGPAAFTITAAALRLTFGAARLPSRPPYEDLTEPQRRTVRILAELGEDTWQWANFTQILRAWNLPDQREECRRYAGI